MSKFSSKFLVVLRKLFKKFGLRKGVRIKRKKIFSKIKSFFSKLSRRKKFALGLALFLALLGFYPLFALRAISPADLALADLKNSWQQEIICHQACSLQREKNEQLIIHSLKLDSRAKSSLAQNLKTVFQTPGQKIEFQEEIIRIWSLAAGKNNPPQYFKDYLDNSEANPELQGGILKFFSLESLVPDSFKKETASSSPWAYYFQVLNSQRPLIFKEAIVSALSTSPQKAQYFSREQLEILGEIVLNPKSAQKLRQSLIFLIADYYSFFPQESQLVLERVYLASTSPQSLDVISRVFAADILNQKLSENLVLPEISASEWQEYYNN